jgi:hypothetical protein
MQRFKTGDPVLILPKFAHLYPGDSAVITTAKPDLFRTMFNEYTVEFSNGSTADLFEFQILENASSYTTYLATMVFDSQQQGPMVQTRGHLSGRHLVLQTATIDIDMRIQVTKARASVIGQVLERGTTNFLTDTEVRLMKESIPLVTASSDNIGMFKFSSVPRGSLNVLVIIPQSSLRILGALFV